MLQMIHSLHLHRLKTDHADNKLVCNLSVLGKTDLLQICCRSAGFVRVVGSLPCNYELDMQGVVSFQHQHVTEKMPLGNQYRRSVYIHISSEILLCPF